MDTEIRLTTRPAARGKTLVVALRGDADLHRDEVNLDRAADRERFVRSLVRAAFPAGDPPADVRGSLLDKLKRLAAIPLGGPPAAEVVHAPAPDLPTVLIEVAEYRTNDAVVAILPQLPGLYERSGRLVRVTGKAAAGREVSRAEGLPTIQHHDRYSLREDLTRCVGFVKKRKAQGEIVEVPDHPPDWCVCAVERRGHWPGVPELLGIVSYPVVLRDGTILTSAGYDPASKLYLTASYDLDLPEVLDQPAAAAAAAKLVDIVCDFPFVDDSHRSAWLSGVLTPLARFAYSGSTPLHLFESNTPGTGKSLLADLVASIVTGTDFARVTYPDQAAEQRKVLTTLIAAGDPFVLLDNLAGRLGDPALDAALTATHWKDRLLGGNEWFEGPVTTCFYASGNNLQIHADTARRLLPCRIESGEEHPEDRDGFKYQLPEHAQENRQELLSAALTLLAAYIRAGRPAPLRGWGSFAGWSELVRSAIVWAGLPDPAASRERLREESDRDATAMRALLAALEKVQKDGGCTAREIAKNAGLDGKNPEVAVGWGDVAEALDALEVTRSDRLGHRLKKFHGRIFGGRKLSSTGLSGGAVRWKVVDVKERAGLPPEPAATGLFDEDEDPYAGTVVE